MGGVPDFDFFLGFLPRREGVAETLVFTTEADEADVDFSPLLLTEATATETGKALSLTKEATTTETGKALSLTTELTATETGKALSLATEVAPEVGTLAQTDLLAAETEAGFALCLALVNETDFEIAIRERDLVSFFNTLGFFDDETDLDSALSVDLEGFDADDALPLRPSLDLIFFLASTAADLLEAQLG